MRKLLSKVGPLRVVHALFLLVLVMSAPYAGGEGARSGWAMWPTLIAPALVPIFMFVLPLDMMMAAIWRSASKGDERRRLTTVLWFDVVLMAVLIGAWLPFFFELLEATR